MPALLSSFFSTSFSSSSSPSSPPDEPQTPSLEWLMQNRVYGLSCFFCSFFSFIFFSSFFVLPRAAVAQPRPRIYDILSASSASPCLTLRFVRRRLPGLCWLLIVNHRVYLINFFFNVPLGRARKYVYLETFRSQIFQTLYGPSIVLQGHRVQRRGRGRRPRGIPMLSVCT